LSTYDGLKRLEQNTWVPLFEDSLAKKYIYTSYKDNANRFWFGTKQDGVLSISSAGNIKMEFVHIPLSFNLVSGFFEDRDKNIWVAGFRGLLKLTPAYFKTLSLPAFQKMGTIRKSISMPSGKTLLSGDDGQIMELQPQRQGGALPIPSNSFHLDAANDFIDFSSFDDVGRVWFTTRESNLYRLDDRKLKKFNSIVFPGNNHFRGLCYNKKQKKLYVCGDSVLLSGDENHLDTFFSEPTHQFIPLPLNIYVEEDNGSMLVQTLENGLFLMTGKNEIQPVDKKINFSLAVLNTGGNNDRENIIWAVYQGKSIMKYRWKTNQVPKVIDSITEKNGLPYNYILDLVIDDEKKIWLATSKGIVLMQKEANGKWITQHVLINESGSFSPLSFSRLMNDRLGNIWLTLQDKVLIFNSAKTKLSPIETHTVIENVLLFNQPTNWTPATDSVEGYRMVPVHPVLNYNQNTLSIFFNGLQYSDNFQTEYTYRLAPLDTSWSSPGQSNSVSFYQLAPANYSFQVRSRLKGFEWGEAAVFAFKIKIPIWDRWWFRLAIILIASGIIFFMFRQRLKQLNIRTGLKNQLRELEMKALKAQMNPHFIHNALNSIQSLIINHRSEEAGYYVSKFARLLRQVFENSEKNLISLEKELDTLQLYVDLEMLRLNREVIYHIHIDEDLIVSEIKIPPLILQPFVENALWHGLNNKTGQKMLTASITEKDGYIVCEITDNGVGRKKAGEVSNNFPEGNLSMAVHTTRQRLLEFNQSPNVEPVSFIDLVEGNVPAGTKVVIRIKSTYGQA
ncbi:MAG: histidine kinase, partial [Ferruginibacter sp.]